MKPCDADRIIAEYMGALVTGEYVQESESGYFLTYSQSLDALVPVWEKLDIRSCINNAIFILQCAKQYKTNNIFESAAIATAKAILELEKK